MFETLQFFSRWNCTEVAGSLRTQFEVAELVRKKIALDIANSRGVFELNFVSSRPICDQLRQLSAYPYKTYLLLLNEKSRVWNWKVLKKSLKNLILLTHSL